MTRVERYHFIRLKMVDLIEDVELYLNLWRYDPGSSGTTGYRIGSTRGNLNKALESWKTAFTAESFVEFKPKGSEPEFYGCEECGEQFLKDEGVVISGFGFCKTCMDKLDDEREKDK
ncbi:hypothetical protein N9L20_02010 [Flavobacteriaceae bacterium]|nr:hypothetical protein [Flavobacteriaceae bacterium]